MPSTVDQLVDLFTDTIISQDSNDVPYKELKVWVDYLAELYAVLDAMEAMNDRNALTGVNLDMDAAQWGLTRDGQSDADFQARRVDQIAIYYSGNTITDFWYILNLLGMQSDARIIQNTPPESAELNIELAGASDAELARILAIAEQIKAAGIQIEVYSVRLPKLLKEDGGGLTQESGDYILLNVGTHATTGRYLSEDGNVFINESTNDYYLQE